MLLRVLSLVRPTEESKRLARLLEDKDLLLTEVKTAVELWQALQTEPAELVIASEAALSDPTEAAVEGLRGLPHPPGVLVVRTEDDAETRARLLGAGVEAVLYTGMSDEGLAEILTAVLAKLRREAVRKIEQTRSTTLPLLDAFRTRSPRMQRVMELARRVVQADSSVLILGETGVGKEFLARAIHENGPRGTAPFIAVNCGAIVESLMESELFGHEQGAFTGATRAHRGHFEVAHRGTIFLDEIGEMPPHVQVKLLRVLQDRTIQRVGGEKELQVDVRVLAATNRDLTLDVRERHFRSDLFYRIGVVSIEIPPLRERREDIPELVRTQMSRLQQRLRPDLMGMDEAVMRALVAYDWPGNIRELVNVLERAMLITEGDRLRLRDLPEGVVRIPRDRTAERRIDMGRLFRSFDDGLGEQRQALVGPQEARSSGRGYAGLAALPLEAARRQVLDEFERDYLVTLLQREKGRVGAVARAAGISPRALFDKMKRHGLRKEDYKG